MTKLKDSIDDAVAAFGEGCTLAARGAYHRKYGAAAYDEELAKWGSDPHTLKAGIRPPEYGSPEHDEQTTNPWKTGDIDRIHSCLKSLPTKVCARLALAAGKKIDGTPLNK